MFDKKIWFAALLALILAGLGINFFSEFIYKNEYSYLLKNNLKLEDLKLILAVLFFVIPLCAYLINVFILKNNEEITLIAILFYVFSFLSLSFLFSIEPLKIGNVDGIKAIFPLIVLSLFTILKNETKVLFLIIPIGIALAYSNLAPVGAFLLIFSSVKGLEVLFEKKSAILLGILGSLIVASSVLSNDLVQMLSIAIGSFVFILILLLIRKLGESEIYAFFAFLILFTLFTNYWYVEKSRENLPLTSEVKIIKEANKYGEKVFVLGFEDFYKYYGLKDIESLNREILLSNENRKGVYIINLKELEKMFSDEPIIFKYFLTFKEDETNWIGIFENKRYVIYVSINDNKLGTIDGVLIDKNSNERLSVPFTKIRLFDEEKDYNDKRNRLILSEKISKTLLEKIIKGKKVTEENEVYLFVVK